MMCYLLLPLKRRFHDSQIVILTYFAVVSSVGKKRVVCMTKQTSHNYETTDTETKRTATEEPPLNGQ